MAKTATKRKEINTASIKRRLSAALIMLLVSSVMLVATTYAWFTLSTAPEVKSIDATVAGNGSLEIALLPADGAVGSINNGRRGDSGTYAGGNALATTANVSWGNLLDLSDASYGLGKLQLTPAHAEATTAGGTTTLTFGTVSFGYDGRVKSETPTAVSTSYSFNTTKFNGTHLTYPLPERRSTHTATLLTLYSEQMPEAATLFFRVRASSVSTATAQLPQHRARVARQLPASRSPSLRITLPTKRMNFSDLRNPTQAEF